MERYVQIVAVLLLTGLAYASAQAETGQTYLQMVASHLRHLSTSGTDRYGPVETPMWMSVIDVRTGQHPMEDHVPARVYRRIGAPHGTTLYWDQPLVVAAYALSHATGDTAYAGAAERYIRSFLDRCVDGDGMFLWGNHAYYDAFQDTVVRFSGGYHELRPLTPAWDLFWQSDSLACEKYIRTMAPRHIYDADTGGFNRHDDGKKGDAFIEAGGVLVETLSWLYNKTDDSELLETALSIARYSYDHRGTTTGLVINQPDNPRWDSKVTTTEVGVWAQSLLRASAYASENAFAEMAENAVRAYLTYGYDEKKGMYYGQVNVADGKPVFPEKKGYWPGAYADVWNCDQWPTHDYPMAVAEACITLYDRTKDPAFLTGIHRWAKIIADHTPARNGQGAYAENYGRCIHFLARAGRDLNDAGMVAQARVLAKEAVGQLYKNGMFQGYPGTNLYESVDGVGYLCLALIYLETGRDLNLYGFGF